MKKKLILFVVLPVAGLISFGGAFALAILTTSSPPPDPNETQSPQAKAAQSGLETEFAPREQELLSLQKDIRALEDRLARDSAVMSETESSKLERDILAKRRDLKRSQDEFRDDLNIRKNEVLSKLQRQMYDATVGLAKEKKFDIILGQGVVYSNDSVDITDQVLEKLKKEFKASGGK